MFTVLEPRFGLYINNNYLVFKSFKPVGVAYKNLIIQFYRYMLLFHRS